MEADGNLDVLVGDGSGNIYGIKGKVGTLIFRFQVDNGVAIKRLFLADINGDGLLEIAGLRTKRGEVVVLATNIPCKAGETICGRRKLNDQNNPVIEK